MKFNERGACCLEYSSTVSVFIAKKQRNIKGNIMDEEVRLEGNVAVVTG